MERKHIDIVSFSGGKDSTAMLLLMLEKNIQIDEIIFCDTGMEFPEMYGHIENVKTYINRPITILKADKSFEYYMFDHVKTKGKNKGSKGYSWPDFRNRWCTQALKKSVIKRYLRKYKDFKVIEYHGIAFDESYRSNKNCEKIIKYPLIEWGLCEEECLQYCYNEGFTWNGLYKQFKRVSCWCCPLQSLKDLKSLYQYHYELWQKLKEMDSKSWNKFRLDYTLEQLEERFKKEIWLENNQLCMF